MSDNIYLTDEQYLQLLGKVKQKVIQNKDINMFVYDSTDMGNKYTTSNIGLCNEKEYTTLETALFPKDFKEYNRCSMKYRCEHHLCPFDYRIFNPKKYELMNGCYYTCALRYNQITRLQALERIEICKNLLKQYKGEED